MPLHAHTNEVTVTMMKGSMAIARPGRAPVETDAAEAEQCIENPCGFPIQLKCQNGLCAAVSVP